MVSEVQIMSDVSGPKWLMAEKCGTLNDFSMAVTSIKFHSIDMVY
jgi:hypothetical protein